ncbi:bromodomain-containing protein 9-like [Liolophura sinensis]|uniref:bromodomain-containing protein 9-like n=1 Tax=Liolophura sinensis TaxID=3198878 RepID=UPI00315881F4
MGSKKHKSTNQRNDLTTMSAILPKKGDPEVKEGKLTGEKPGLKLVLNLKGASTPTPEPLADVYHEEKRHKHKKKKKKKSSDKEKHRHHESRKRERMLSESESVTFPDH